MIAKMTLLLYGIVSLVEAADIPSVQFSDQFKDFYPAVVDAVASSLAGLPLEEAVAVKSPQQEWTATVHRTNGSKVAYDQSRGRIEIAHEGQAATMIGVHGFRTITVTWINDRLLHIYLGLGRVAAVDAIYDMVGRRWLYQDSISYPP